MTCFQEELIKKNKKPCVFKRNLHYLKMINYGTDCGRTHAQYEIKTGHIKFQWYKYTLNKLTNKIEYTCYSEKVPTHLILEARDNIKKSVSLDKGTATHYSKKSSLTVSLEISRLLFTGEVGIIKDWYSKESNETYRQYFTMSISKFNKLCKESESDLVRRVGAETYFKEKLKYYDKIEAL